eukprot:403364148
MGGNNSKNNDFYNNPELLAKANNFPFSKNQNLDGFNSKQNLSNFNAQSTRNLHQNTYSQRGYGDQNQQPNMKQSKSSHNIRSGHHMHQASISNYVSNIIEEDDHKIPINKSNYVTKNTMSKRQQNAIPQMTKRLMQKQNVILCKTPAPHSQTASKIMEGQIQTPLMQTTDQINHNSTQSQSVMRFEMTGQSQQSSHFQGGMASKNYPLHYQYQMHFNETSNTNMTTPSYIRNPNLQMSILSSTGDSRQQNDSLRKQFNQSSLNNYNMIAQSTSNLRNHNLNQIIELNDAQPPSKNIGSSVKKEFEKQIQKIHGIDRRMNKSSTGIASTNHLRPPQYEGSQKSHIKHMIKSSVQHNQKMNHSNIFITERGSVNQTIQDIKNKKTQNTSQLLSTSASKSQLRIPRDKIIASQNTSVLGSARQSQAFKNRKESFDTQLKTQLKLLSGTNNSLSSISQGLQSLVQYTDRQKSQQIPPWKVQELEQNYYKIDELKNQIIEIKKSPSQKSMMIRNASQVINQSSIKLQSLDSTTMKSSNFNQHRDFLQETNMAEFLNQHIADQNNSNIQLRTTSTFNPLEASIQRRRQAGDQKEFSLPNQIVMLILQFNMNEYAKYLRISAGWYYSINDSLDEYAQVIETAFVNKYSKYLNFIRSFNSATPINFCNQRGVRLDRVLQCEITQSMVQMINQTLRIGNSFEYMPAPKKNTQSFVKGAATNFRSQTQSFGVTRYSNEYRLDIIKKNSQRITWIHISDDLPVYSQNELQLSPGDMLEIAVCIYNMNGLINLNSIEWDQPELMNIPQNERNPLVYNKDVKALQYKEKRKGKVYANTNRICEVEDSVVEWIPFTKSQRPKLEIDFHQLLSHFNIMSIHFNEVDQHFNKIVIQAKKQGVAKNKCLGENVELLIKPADSFITNEIKKKGFMFDRNKDCERLQLRVGDILVIYNSKRIPMEMQPDIVFAELSEYNTKMSNANGGYQDDDQTESTNQHEDERDQNNNSNHNSQSQGYSHNQNSRMMGGQFS